MSDDSNQTPDDADAGPKGPSSAEAEDLARRLRPNPDIPRDRTDAAEATRSKGPIRLDKSGALAGQPKLAPRKVHRDEDGVETEAGGREPPSEGAPRKAILPPKRSELRPAGFEPAPEAPRQNTAHIPSHFQTRVEIPAGTFKFGETKEAVELGAFDIDRYPVTNVQYEVFVRETSHRPPMYWPNGQYPDELASHPVVGVDYFDALAYAQWQGRDLPFEDEWERAARGTDGRTYPWGEDNDPSRSNTARLGLKMTMPADHYVHNVSADGLQDTVGNAWEFTHSPAPGGGVVVRGGSWYDFALYAKTWFRFASKPDSRNGTIGFRTVSREAERPDAAREVDVSQLEGEIESRRGSQAPVSAEEFSPERRDLVPDLRKLRSLMAERSQDEVVHPLAAERATRAPESAKKAAPSPLTPPAPEKAASKGAPPATSPPREHVGSTESAPKPPLTPPRKASPPKPISVTQPGGKAAAATGATPLRGVDQSAAMRAAEQVDHATAAQKAAAAAPTPVKTSWAPWVALGIGALLLVGIAIAIFSGDDPEKIEVNTPPVPAHVPENNLPDLPPLVVQSFLDERPLELHDGSEIDTQVTLSQGVWLLIFLPEDTARRDKTIRTAEMMSKRLAAHDLEVAYVLPDAALKDASGRLPEGEALRAKVASLFTLRGPYVIIDPAGDGERGPIGEQILRERLDHAALLISDGSRESRTKGPKDRGFDAHDLAPIVLQAAEIAPLR